MAFTVIPALGAPLSTDDVLDAFDLARRCGVGTVVERAGVVMGRIVAFTMPRAEPLRDSVGLLGRGS
jgi:hypothetical protein